jgi:hypothetical protein
LKDWAEILIADRLSLLQNLNDIDSMSDDGRPILGQQLKDSVDVLNCHVRKRILTQLRESIHLSNDVAEIINLDGLFAVQLEYAFEVIFRWQFTKQRIGHQTYGVQ